jgi:hypothetical protein
MNVHYPETTSDMPETVSLATVEEIFLFSLVQPSHPQ